MKCFSGLFHSCTCLRCVLLREERVRLKELINVFNVYVGFVFCSKNWSVALNFMSIRFVFWYGPKINETVS